MAPSPAQPPRPDAAVLEIRKDRLGFAAAHFSILESGSERIHGHNYRVSLRAHGRVRADGTVVDFGALKSVVAEECNALDHHMLIPAEEVRVLPVANTTCECLAGFLLGRLRARLPELPARLEVEVEESPGQGATVAEQSGLY